ncbi:hypothetical protein [Porphyromonas levii]|uniref:hypothetical protein n=1 Tax=Porphyromonas levii TaxID=28114 RepID=UPI001B8D751E|nr:hypothetical protein [Porphyromonas levii]MBR8712989.1 hypothetical protein [Porphyromonas levii]MBR8715036.1 hypothetical protein [Porphyromonas levii]MBR8727521.1 hypothetical protein [Porphyromonas levii]MBR8735856.1 hypothetical protein [Porphyromonas levii]MBR8774217.1 hypothetical protein [Porphyromonas levii]
MNENEYNLRAEEEEAWGDDELTAIDLSIPFLLEKADWTKFFNTLGYDGQYPFLLYGHEDAEVLHDRLLAEVNRTQILQGHNKLQCDLYTRFGDYEGKVVGFVWLAISGTRAFAPDLLDNLQWLLQSGTTTYLEHAYTSHGAEAELTWLETPTQYPAYATVEAHQPPQSNLQLADRLSIATILPR